MKSLHAVYSSEYFWVTNEGEHRDVGRNLHYESDGGSGHHSCARKFFNISAEEEERAVFYCECSTCINLAYHYFVSTPTRYVCNNCRNNMHPLPTVA